jgi:hypothetical protein
MDEGQGGLEVEGGRSRRNAEGVLSIPWPMEGVWMVNGTVRMMGSSPELMGRWGITLLALGVL